MNYAVDMPSNSKLPPSVSQENTWLLRSDQTTRPAIHGAPVEKWMIKPESRVLNLNLSRSTPELSLVEKLPSLVISAIERILPHWSTILDLRYL